MDKKKVVVVGKMWPEPDDKLAERCEVKHWAGPGALPNDQLEEWLSDAEGLLTVGHEVRVNAGLLDAAPNLRVVAQAGAGYDNIDVAACTERGIPFGNTPGILVETVADFIYGLILCSARRIHDGWNFVKAGQWCEVFGSDLQGKKLGIIGMGEIGAAVARRAAASGMHILYYNRTQRPDDLSLQAQYTGFYRLLGEADFVLNLVPLSGSSRGMFGKEQFAAMKRTAYFINASRGQVVRTADLLEALQTGKIAYAALDVTDPEPIPADHPLLSLPNVLITPHIASATSETRSRMASLAVDNLLAGISRRPLPVCVNPSVNYR